MSKDRSWWEEKKFMRTNYLVGKCPGYYYRDHVKEFGYTKDFYGMEEQEGGVQVPSPGLIAISIFQMVFYLSLLL